MSSLFAMASASTSDDIVLESKTASFFLVHNNNTDGMMLIEKDIHRDCTPLADINWPKHDIPPIGDAELPMEHIPPLNDGDSTTNDTKAECHPSVEKVVNHLPGSDTNAVTRKQSQLPAAVRKLLIPPILDSKVKLSLKRKSTIVSLDDDATCPGSTEGINLVALYEYNGHGNGLFEESEYTSKPINLGWTRFPEFKCRNLVPNSLSSPICEIEVETGSWQVGENDKCLTIIPAHNNSRISIDDGHTSTIADKYKYETIVDVKEAYCASDVQICIESEIEKSRRIEGRMRQQTTLHNARIRIGDKHQAVILDHPSTYDRSTDETNYLRGTVLWDPVKADSAIERNELVAEYLERNDLELNVKYLLMESLNESEYNTKPAMKFFIEKYRKEQKRLVELNATEMNLFNKVIAPRMLAVKKDFVGAAKVMNRTVECVMVHYYLWKRRHRDYQRIKREQRKEPNYCTVCDDGGILIVCELCRKAFHMECCKPKLTRIPVGDWYCTHCTCSSPAQVRRLSTSANTPNGFSNRLTAHDRNKRSSTQRTLNMNDNSTPHLTPSQLRRRSLRDVHKDISFVSTKTEKAREDIKRPSPGEMVWNTKVAGVSRSLLTRGPVNGSVILSSSHNSMKSTLQSDVSRKASAISKRTDSTFNDYEDDSTEKEAQANKRQRMSSPCLNDQKQFVFYDTQLPITSEGLLVHISEIPAKNGGGVAFNGYRRFKSGKIGPAEEMGLFRSVGDKFHCVDGTFCAGKNFSEIKALLKDCVVGQKIKYLRMSHMTTAGVVSSNCEEKREFKSMQALPQTTKSTGLSMMQRVDHSFKDPAIYSVPVHVSSRPGNRPIGANSMIEAGLTPISNITAQQQLQPSLATVYSQPVVAPKINTEAHTNNRKPFNEHFYNLQNALAPLRVPDLLQFLTRRGIFDANAFLQAASPTLAAQWSAERGVTYDLAMDFIGAARLQVRQFFFSNGLGR